MNYVNIDKNLIPKETRTFVKINKEEFMDKLFDLYKIYLENLENKDKEDENNYPQTIEDLGFVYAWSVFCTSHHNKLNILSKDLEEFEFDGENFYAKHSEDSEQNNLLGFYTFKNGLTILGCAAGGDWEHPLFFFYYFDGKNIRAYVPHYGNTVNLDTKTAFGSETEHHKMISDEYSEEVRQYARENNLFYHDEDDSEEDRREIEKHLDSEHYTSFYLSKQDIRPRDDSDYSNDFDIDYHWDSIKEEILTVFKESKNV